MSDWKQAIFFTLCVKVNDRCISQITLKPNETLQSSLEE